MLKLLSILAASLSIASAFEVPSYPDTPEFKELRALIKRREEGDPIVHEDITDHGVPAHGVQGFDADIRSRIPLTCREFCYHPATVYR